MEDYGRLLPAANISFILQVNTQQRVAYSHGTQKLLDIFIGVSGNTVCRASTSRPAASVHLHFLSLIFAPHIRMPTNSSADLLKFLCNHLPP